MEACLEGKERRGKECYSQLEKGRKHNLKKKRITKY